MALDRKDVRAKLDPEAHKALREVCEVEGVSIGDWVEELILRELRHVVRKSNLIADRTRGLGIIGNRRDSQGRSGRGGE